MQRISSVGFIVTPEGIEIEPDGVRTVTEWRERACHRDIQVFLGFANFYRRFRSSFSRLMNLMTDMLNVRKNGLFSGPFLPTLAMKWSFAELRNAFTKAPVLAHFNPARPISLETDALGFAMAGIFSQQ
jgi:hypothetical protein